MKKTDIDRRFKLFQEILSSSVNFSFLVFDANGKIIHQDNVQTKDQETLALSRLGSLRGIDYLPILQQHARDFQRDDGGIPPLIIPDMLGLHWIAAYQVRRHTLSRIYLMGPAYTSETAAATLDIFLSKQNFAQPLRREIKEKFSDVPVVMLPLLQQYAIMLHKCITGETVPLTDLRILPYSEQINGEPVSPDPRNYGRIFRTEQLLLHALVRGDDAFFAHLRTLEELDAHVHLQSHKTLREGRDTVIMLITLLSRVSAKNGVPVDTACFLAEYYINMTEQCDDAGQLTILRDAVCKDYLGRIRKAKKEKTLSPAVAACRDYINLHIYEDVSIKQLSSMTGYTPYYLSRKFKSETGVSINDYMTDQKIRYAKHQLTDTDLEIAEISEQLHFCTGSYFSKIFRQRTGMGPQEYRDKYRC